MHRLQQIHFLIDRVFTNNKKKEVFFVHLKSYLLLIENICYEMVKVRIFVVVRDLACP